MKAQWKVGAVDPAPFDGNKASRRTHFLNRNCDYNPYRKVRHQKVCRSRLTSNPLTALLHATEQNNKNKTHGVGAGVRVILKAKS